MKMLRYVADATGTGGSPVPLWLRMGRSVRLLSPAKGLSIWKERRQHAKAWKLGGMLLALGSLSCSASAQGDARATLRFPIYELALPLGRHAFLVLAASEDGITCDDQKARFI
jgi:hypothetical protein